MFRFEITADPAKLPADDAGFPIYFDLANAPLEFFDEVRFDGGEIRVPGVCSDV